MANSSWGILPKTNLGKWSVGLLVAMPILFVIGTSLMSSLYQSVPSGDNLLADIAARPGLALTMLAGNIAGITAFISGLAAIIRQKERGMLVYLATVIGGVLTLFLASMVLFPE